MRNAALALVLFALACDRGPGPDAQPVVPAPGPGAAAPASRALQTGWQEPGSGAINVRRARDVDLTGDGESERIAVTAQGLAYDSLLIRLSITGATGDTLWLDTWWSGRYFEYEPIAGRPDTTIARIVQAHVDTLLHESWFTARGLPPVVRGDDLRDTIDESVRFHLAEIDFRNRASLDPRHELPEGSWDRIQPNTVIPERVTAVRQELEAGPTFMYYAGGEVSHVIGWSVREQAFVRLFSCC